MQRAGDRRPAVRAASVQDVLAYLDAHEPGAQARVRELIPEDVQEVIDAAPRMGWIDVEDDVWVPTSIWRVFGHDEATALLRRFMLRHLNGAVLGPLVQKTARVFGLTPASAVRMLPIGWPMVYRDVAALEVRALGAGAAEIALRDVAPTVLASAAYLASFRAIFLGLIELTGHDGEVRMGAVDAAAARVPYALAWG